MVDGIRVRGLDANDCPGSMLLLFEQDWHGRLGKQRILHCGDFRASAEHLNHPLLRPGKDGANGQKLDFFRIPGHHISQPEVCIPQSKECYQSLRGTLRGT